MKKLLLISAGLFVMALLAGQPVQAQSQAQSIAMTSGKAITASLPYPGNYNISAKAIRNFTRYYQGVTDPQWSLLNDGGYIVSFARDNARYRVYYTKRGNWLHTITGYEENNLPTVIRSLVKSTYFDYTILYVNEISLPQSDKIYIVQIQNARELKVLRVTEDGMETLQEMVRL